MKFARNAINMHLFRSETEDAATSCKNEIEMLLLWYVYIHAVVLIKTEREREQNKTMPMNVWHFGSQYNPIHMDLTLLIYTLSVVNNEWSLKICVIFDFKNETANDEHFHCNSIYISKNIFCSFVSKSVWRKKNIQLKIDFCHPVNYLL